MAEIVLGLGSSHGPMLSTPPEQWGVRVAADRANPELWYRGAPHTFDELAGLRAAERYADQATPAVWRDKHAACRAALDELADVFAEARVDVAVIFGNDQAEIFGDDLVPALSVYRGAQIPNLFPDEDALKALPVGIEVSVPGHVPPQGAVNPGHPDLATHIVERAVADEFDVTVLNELPKRSSHIPHAFGFIYRQIMKDAAIPSVPVLFNTFYPPNQPTLRRCHEFGRSVVRAVESWESDARVALIASGGLSHYVIDEDLDRTFLDAVTDQSFAPLEKLGEEFFTSGTSELKNWVPVAGAMADLGFTPTVVDYVPCYRSEAGTGISMGFVHWRP
ncbi:hypothetical protein [Actinocorallia sp. A-T 12471]|uniref:DODA-type extradiol aromatic ring-opening family dioxygenase n=1 Tax=Actinocorallia sp. A-T 12471 TaxID=3089813 RepID=UPI0029CADD35|nr:hypothetical protein [Actinocorallia sp. A-T 12471]MDX6740616.1 hypothetical protein [Actinocorallia sp. A-T 12471]